MHVNNVLRSRLHCHALRCQCLNKAFAIYEKSEQKNGEAMYSNVE